MIISIPVSIGEAIDKLSILQIKSEKITRPDKLRFILQEIQAIKEALSNLADYENCLSELRKINLEMWDCNEERKTKINNKQFDKEYVELTIIESKVNDLRFEIKNKINQKFDSTLREQKSYNWIT
jgi:hypothetical protein